MPPRPRWVPWIIAAWVVLLGALAISGDLRAEPLLTLEIVNDELDDPVAVVGDPDVGTGRRCNRRRHPRCQPEAAHGQAP